MIRNNMKIFLSGSVKKSDDKRSNEFFWSENDENLLKKLLGGDVEILNPAMITIPRHMYRERFVADMDMLFKSDVVVVDARTKKGLGVGAEMALAKQKNIPVFTLCPLSSEYRGEDWIHPFVAGLSDGIFETIEDLAEEIKLISKK